MAEKRMFTQKIVDSDAFLDMPLSTQALYFHLNMRADDDGFVNNPKRIQRTIGASEDDLKLLFAKRFVIGFESGVIVIKHWRMHNTLRKDRYNPTQYQDELSTLEIKDNNAYTERVSELPEPETKSTATTWQPNGNQMEPQYSLVEYSLDKANNIYTPGPQKEAQENDCESYKTIISYLNEKAGTKYRASTAKTKTVIHARLSEGFTVEDFKTVIDKKCAEWIGTDYEKFLRPETLFGTKFEGYLNQKERTRANEGTNGAAEKQRLGQYF